MARIGISINEVLRDFLGQLSYTADKYLIDTKTIIEGEVKDLNLINYLVDSKGEKIFKSVNELNTFLYAEHPLEIFGHADLVTENLMTHFNYLLTEIKDEEKHEVEIVSREIDKSIPATLFFLSKTACQIDKIRFVTENINEWDGVDILITANPDALANKPAGKTSIKIKSSYNTDIASDYELDSLVDFIKDENLKDKILNTKIINYE